MNIRKFEVTISGATMLHHNSRLSDPLDPYAKALKEASSKKKKSDEDHIEIGRREYMGGLYFEDGAGPVVYGHMLEAAIVNGAKKNKLGKEFKATIRVPEDHYPLEYKGPRTREGLWADPKFVDRRNARVQQSKVMRTRAKFRDWKVKFNVELLPGASNPSDVEEALVNAGLYEGIGDYRPKFGSFTVDSFKEITA